MPPGHQCILDLHNYCRYQDFLFNPDGSVDGLVKPANPLLYAYTSDNTRCKCASSRWRRARR